MENAAKHCRYRNEEYIKVYLIKPYKGYLFEYKETYKNPVYNNRTKKVAQYSLDGTFIREYKSVQEAFNIYGPGVKKCVKGLQTQTKGFIFKIIS